IQVPIRTCQGCVAAFKLLLHGFRTYKSVDKWWNGDMKCVQSPKCVFQYIDPLHIRELILLTKPVELTTKSTPESNKYLGCKTTPPYIVVSGHEKRKNAY
ncbi:hypothetical protein C5167_043944, partial [Papaver somniferum]